METLRQSDNIPEDCVVLKAIAKLYNLTSEDSKAVWSFAHIVERFDIDVNQENELFSYSIQPCQHYV